jgi:phosphopentomutase
VDEDYKNWVECEILSDIYIQNTNDLSKRTFLIVLDSVGIGEMPDAADYGDRGSNTLLTISKNQNFSAKNLQKLGFLNISGINFAQKTQFPTASFARMGEASKGKDTTIGHWEICGVVSQKPLPTYPNGFPVQIIKQFEEQTGKKTLCNLPYSGTEVIKKFGKQHQQTGHLIIYTSADSVFQIAAHQAVVPVQELYTYCEIARKILVGEHGVGRVIARPFEGEFPNYSRTSHRHDFSLPPPSITMLDQLKESDLDVIAVGKISDIFSGRGITESIKTSSNKQGIQTTIDLIKSKDFEGLCFVNLVDFDMLYGHRNDIAGYAKAFREFDENLPQMIQNLRKNDVLIITADHGCDPGTASTDHSREYTPMVIFGDNIKKGIDLGTRDTFADIGATVLDYFGLPPKIAGNSFFGLVKNYE